MSAKYAFFDVDETIINIKSMFDFLAFYLEKKYPQDGKDRFKFYVQKMRSISLREETNRYYYTLFRGENRQFVLRIGEEWYKNQKNIFNKTVLEKLKTHQNRGDTIAFVSGSFEACLQPIAEDLRVGNVLCTRLDHHNNRYTGKILPPLVIGEGKAEIIKDFLLSNHARPTDEIYVYGDHISDLAMLKLATHPSIVDNCPDLRQYAITHKWEIISSTLGSG